MKKFEKFIAIIISAVMVLSLVACSGKEPPKETVKQTEKPQNEEPKSDNPTKITFWFSMGGTNMEILESIIKGFNDSQDKIIVEGTYQGSYEESINKLKTVGGTKEAPTLIQVYDGGTLFMKNSGFFIPVQQFIDKENFDISVLEPAITSYYTDYEGNLNSMPFNSSEPVMYYNKDMFKAANLDPEKPPLTLDEIADYASKLTIRNGNTVETYGFTMMIHAWFFEQIMANTGELYVNNDNGRKDIPTEAVFDNEKGLKFFQWLDKMYREGTATSYGRGWNEFRTAFLGEKVAICFDSSANLAAAIKTAPFEVGTVRLPTIEGNDPQGCPVGGASLWMLKGPSEAEQQAAWEFIKYLTKPEVQADWHIKTGYFPINKEAYNLQNVKDNLVQYPQFKAPIDQVQNTKISPATQGVLVLNMQAIRDEVNTCLEGLFEGILTPEDALKKASQGVTKVLETDAKMQ